ncbi:hypothetical protein ALC56_05178 [Trachymyrmex septentrionalis]|uniref:Uncharacterized protein n=1 Tax=Trachymyrmex septentrionalis TaxID=34720 RepID=A0A195FIK7_9HYME|nr:hypothetical protein ALC56_05178 [Trachymyrmex septentrionalis]
MHSGRLGSWTYRKAGYRIHRHPGNAYLSGRQTSDRQRAEARSWNPNATSIPRIRRREHPCGAIPLRGVVGAAVPHEQLDSVIPRVVQELSRRVGTHPGGGVKTNRKFTLVVRRVECASGNKRVAANPTYLFTAIEANYTKLHENASNLTEERQSRK